MITVSIEPSFQHFAAIYEPADSPSPIHGQLSQFQIFLPNDIAFRDCYADRSGNYKATSGKPPLLFVGGGTGDDFVKWSKLVNKANRFQLPLDLLLKNRPLKVACRIYERSAPYKSSRFGITLNAVQILGDLTKSDALDDEIAKISGWFNEKG